MLGCDKYWSYLSFCVCGIARVSSIVILCYIVQDQTGGHSPILVIFYADGEISAGLDHGGLLVVLQAVPGHRRDRDSCNLTCEMGGVAGGHRDGGLVGGDNGEVLHQQGDVHCP